MQNEILHFDIKGLFKVDEYKAKQNNTYNLHQHLSKYKFKLNASLNISFLESLSLTI